jgi:asparagine synthase (glutamine-hydrolysing)
LFSYVALAWDVDTPTHCATARRLETQLRSQARWQATFAAPGLQVFVRGERAGANGHHTLATRGIVLGRLFRRRDLGAPASDDVVLDDTEVAQILGSGGRTLVHDFWGRYVAFMHYAVTGPRVLRDPSGTLPCHRMRHAGVWIVFSWLEDVLDDLPQVSSPRVSQDGLAARLLFGELQGRETALEGVEQVLPGEAVGLGAKPLRERLWSAVGFARDQFDDDPHHAAIRLRDTVRGCVRSWAASHDHLVLRLSGGVDSSIVLACLVHGSDPSHVTCLNLHSPGSDSDERRYARLAAQQAGCELVERERDPTVRLDRFLTVACTPTPGNYVGRLSAPVDGQLAAQRGATAVFTGAGGDQLFFEIPRWWPLADYLHWRGLDRGVFAAAMDAARLGRVSVWSAIASAIAERVRPTVPWQQHHADLPLLGAATSAMAASADRFMHPDLLEATDLPLGKASQTHYLLHPTAYHDPFHPDAPETVHPLLSQPLVELCLQLPTWLLTRGGRGRALARRAFAAELPAPIATRRSKGGIEEHIKAVLLNNIDFAREMLLDGDLVRRGLLDRPRVEEALSGRPTTLPVPIGQIHAYLGIEMWLGACNRRAKRTAPL